MKSLVRFTGGYASVHSVQDDAVLDDGDILLTEGASHLALRWTLVDGVLTDRFPGLNDTDALAAHEVWKVKKVAEQEAAALEKVTSTK